MASTDIPRLTSRVSAPGPIPGTMQTAAVVGRSVSRFGETLARIGSQELEIKRKRQAELDSLNQKLALAEFENEVSAERIRIMQAAKAAPSAEDMTITALSELDDIAEQKMDRFGDTALRGEAELRYMTKHRGPFEERMLDAENEKRVGQVNTRLDLALDSMQLDVMRDPAIYTSKVAQGYAVIDELAAIAQIEATAVEERKVTFHRDMGLAQIRGLIQKHPESMEQRLLNGDFDRLVGDPDKVASLLVEARQAVGRAQAARKSQALGVIGNWFRDADSPLEAAEDLASGNIENEEVRAVWDSLTPEDRASVFTTTVTETNRIYTLRNQQRDEDDRENTRIANDKLRAFYFDENMNTENRQVIFDELKNSQFVSLGAVNAMDKYIRSGGVVEDVEADLQTMERAIRAGDVLDESDMVEMIGRDNLEISIGTMRTRLMPMIEARGDQNFRDALNWGQAELGIITGGGILGDVFQDPLNRAAKLEAELRRFRRDNPTGDLWAYAEKAVERLKKQGNASAASAVPQMAISYRAALESGDARQISNARRALIQILVDAGKVDPMAASRSDFDPLGFIEQQGAQ